MSLQTPNAMLRERLISGHGDRVILSTADCGGGLWVTRVSHGPHSGHRVRSNSWSDALLTHEAWKVRITTGVFDCDECDGDGWVECMADRVILGPGGIAGHTTDEWSEPCEHCEEGKRFDEDCHPGVGLT